MLAAVVQDLQAVPGVEVVTLLDEECALANLSLPSRCLGKEREEIVFRELAGASDATLVIAPEWDDILAQRCHWVEDSGGQLLGPTLATIRLAGDKLELGRHFLKHGVPTPSSHAFFPEQGPVHLPFPAVLKPRHGAGSQATFLVRNPAEAVHCWNQARGEGWAGEVLLQPFVPGQPASVAFLTGPAGFIPLVPAAQRISADGRFHYLGGQLPLPADLGARASRLATRAMNTLTGLRGYLGVDLILGDAPDGSQDRVLELNPRLTTSYVGLRALARGNLAEAMLRVAWGAMLPDLAWRTATVHFQTDGKVF